MSSKVVICGAGFLGSYIAKGLTIGTSGREIYHRIQVSSRSPTRVHEALQDIIHEEQLLHPIPADVTKPETLASAFEGANVVVSLVGILRGTPENFERIQHIGARNVADAARTSGAKLIHISAIGADPHSKTSYGRTKALGETAVFEVCPAATVIRPSLVFGPGDGFFTRFAKLSKYLPFMPVFGNSRFQPVYAGDVARAVEIIARNDAGIRKTVDGKIVEAGGPEVFTYRQMMELVLQYTQRRRLIIPLPFALGKIQGIVMEQLPDNLFTITRDQIEQLKADNVVNSSPPLSHVSFSDLINQYSDSPLKSVHEILPTYIGPSSVV